MITRTLKVGDYIFTAKGCLARITKINKQTYTYDSIARSSYNTNIPFNGIRNSYYGSEEWFECDDIQAKALELAFKEFQIAEDSKRILRDVRELIGKAKYFLNQIEDIEEEVLNEVER